MTLTADDIDLRCWQARNLMVVTELIRIGEKQKLPPLSWTVPTVGTITGKTDWTSDPRAQFEAWHDAVLEDGRKRVIARGLDEDRPYRSERTDKSGWTRMLAGFEFLLPHRPAGRFCLLAEFTA